MAPESNIFLNISLFRKGYNSQRKQALTTLVVETMMMRDVVNIELNKYK